jgi:hypothetical protein
MHVSTKITKIILIEEHEGNPHLGHVDKCELIMLKWVLMKYVVRTWTGFIRIRIGVSGMLF